MQNIDYEFKKKAEEDFSIQDQTIKTAVATVTTRQIQEVPAVANQLYTVTDIPEPYRVDAKPFISRPFFIGEVDFPSTAARHSLLSSSIKFLPGDAVRANVSLTNLFKIAALGRPELVLNVSLAGTISHAGCILVGVLPPLPSYPTTPNKRIINTILSGPHAFLFANEATSVALEVPFYCNSDLTTTDMDQESSYVTTVDLLTTNGNYATLVFYVLNPLQPSTGASTSLKIVIEACFKTFELAVPTPRYVTWTAQSGRNSPTIERKPSISLDETLAELTAIINLLHQDLQHQAINPSTPAKEKKKHKYKITRILTTVAPTILSVAAVVGVTARLIISVVADDPQAFENATSLLAETFVPQSGIGGFISGLFDNAASGLKRIANDAVDGGRALVREYTGLHNPNVPINTNRVITTPVNYMNLTDAQQYFEKLDPYAKFDRVVSQPIFGTDIDEMAISHITGKKQYIGSVTVREADAVGKLLWVRPISPFQGGLSINNEDSSITAANNIELLHTMHRGWTGGLKLTIQSVMNNKQQVKLKIIKMYNPSVQSLSNYPVYNTISNAPSHLLEFTAGGQTQEVDLPFLSRNKIMPCATNTNVEAMLHGLYYIYLAQPLANSESSPSEIGFNLYISGAPDLTFYGYVKSSTYHDSFDLYTPSNILSKPISVLTDVTYIHLDENQRFYDPATANFVIDQVKKYNALTGKTTAYKSIPTETTAGDDSPMGIFIKDNAAKRERAKKRIPLYDTYKKQPKFFLYDEAGRVKAIKRLPQMYHSWAPQSGPLEVMNEPQPQHNEVQRDEKEQCLNDMSRLMPTLDVRPLMRRMYKGLSEDVQVDRQANVNYMINLSGLLGEDPTSWAYTPIETLSRMYYGKTVGFKIRLMCTVIQRESDYSTTIKDLLCRVFYLPQDLGIISTTKTVTAALPNLQSFVTPMSASPIGDPPLPISIVARDITDKTVTYEFVVPDTSFFKFLGGPDKFYNFSGSVPYPKLAISDFGSLIVQFTDPTDKPIQFHMEMFVGLTDESRLGFHSIAPAFRVAKHDAYYLGTDTVVNDPATATLNPYTYFGGVPS